MGQPRNTPLAAICPNRQVHPLIGNGFIRRFSSFANATGQAMLCLLFFFFEDTVYGFGNFLERRLIQIRPPSLELNLPKGKGGSVTESIDRMVLGELLHQGIQFASRSPVISHDQNVRFPVFPIGIGVIQGSKALGELFFREDPLVSPDLISGFPRPSFLGRAPCNDQGHFMKVLLGLLAK